MSRPTGEHPDDPRFDYVRSALRDAAQAYQPDRIAMVNRVASGRSAARAKARRRIYPIAAAFAVAVVVVVSVGAVRSTGDRGTAPNPPVAAPRPGSSSAPPVSSAPATRTSTPASPSRSRSSAPTTPAANSAVSAKGRLGPDSVATWSENRVTVTNVKALTALRLTITVARTPGASEAGYYTTVPNNDVTMTVATGATALTYSYVLKQGTTLAPGSYLFAAQFDHHSGRSMSKDGYAVAGATKIADIELSGSFS